MAAYFVWILVVLNIFLKQASTQCNDEINDLTSLVKEQSKIIKELSATIKRNDEQSKQEICLLKNEIEEMKLNQSLITKETVEDRYKFDKQYLNEALDRLDRIAFNAHMSKDVGVQKRKTLIFDVINLNLGHGYNSNTGVFTVPKRGLYVFSLTLHPGENSIASCQLIVNNAGHGVILSDSSENWFSTPASTTVPIWLNERDVVFVRIHPTYAHVRGDILSSGAHLSSFAGWKI